MMPVQLQPEPENFHEEVRQRGHAWLKDKGIDQGQPPPEPSALPPLWQKFTTHLWNAYSGICAYKAIYFEFETGASTTDHFVAKSTSAGEAYEWKNYRISCLDANRRKNNFDDVLDPFEIPEETFLLDYATATIHPNPELEKTNPSLFKKAGKTIERLDLNGEGMIRCRADWLDYYRKREVNANYLKRHSPFVHYELERQGLL